MGYTSDKIVVRTKHDSEEEAHDKNLMERIMQRNQNPFQALVDPLLAKTSYVYHTYLYSSGMMFLVLAFWGAYPSFVRFRHAHVFRYRRTQLSFRRGLFATEHIPKWRKSHLQRIVVPPLPVRELAIARPAAASSVQSIPSSPSDVPSAASVTAVADSAVMKGAARDRDLGFDMLEMSATRTSHASFGAGETENSERTLSGELVSINRDFFGPKSHLFSRPIQEDFKMNDLHRRLKTAVATAKAVVVLRENHSTVRSIPEGWEVWWVSEPEARRRRFCKFWLGGLVCARAFQDLMDMPDMPDFVT
ncbi:hypothetical protein Q4I28_006445 [Leishmania naiffi]|uniref:Uncharacterized protein n=1 Tax=Leishmania naiffi TaxID=5678 RepID=A0AAW3BCW6_9TRYP